jgi:hypothetical protein
MCRLLSRATVIGCTNPDRATTEADPPDDRPALPDHVVFEDADALNFDLNPVAIGERSDARGRAS